MQRNQRNNDNAKSFYLHLPGSGKLSFLLPKVTRLTSSKHYIRVLIAHTCKFHVLYAIIPLHPSACTGSWTFTWDVHSHPWQPPLAGNHGLASAAWAVTSLLLVLYLLWGFLFPGLLESLGVHAWVSTAHWTVTRDVWFYPSVLLTALGDLNLFLLWWMLFLF